MFLKWCFWNDVSEMIMKCDEMPKLIAVKVCLGWATNRGILSACSPNPEAYFQLVLVAQKSTEALFLLVWKWKNSTNSMGVRGGFSSLIPPRMTINKLKANCLKQPKQHAEIFSLIRRANVDERKWMLIGLEFQGNCYSVQIRF